MKNKILTLIVLLITITVVTGCSINIKRRINVSLPELSDIDYVDIDDRSNIVNKRFNDVIKIEDKEEIKKLHDLFIEFQDLEQSNIDSSFNNSSTKYMPEVNINIRFFTKDGESYSFYLERTTNETHISNGRHDFLVDYNKAIEVEELILSKVYKYLIDNFHTDEVQSVRISDLSQFNEPKTITDKNKIINLYYYFYLIGSNTPNTDVNPDNPDKLYHVTFISNKGDEKSYYIYQKGLDYFISVEDDAIYETDVRAFMDVESSFIF